jgi:phenol hydroxylase P3 protein
MADKAKKLSLKEKYQLLTRDLDWETTYQPMDKVFPYDRYEGIRIRDWNKWEDPFRLTMDAYWKYQAEKERKLYAILDAFAQGNGQMNLSDARYMTAVKLWVQGITPLEYYAHRGFAMAGRSLRGAGARVACQMQSIDELRHTQTQIHAFSHYNKYFHGLRQFVHMKDRAWYLSIPKSFFEDALSAGPFEFVTSISFAFEYVLTNLLFMPFVSGAAYNGDMATTTFGFSAQSDESRHMTLGLEVVKFMLEQHEDNVPIVQRWLDKWFWRGYRLLVLVGTMMDYMLPKKVMSWQEAWGIYWEENGIALFHDLARYGIRLPKHHEVASKEKSRITHETWSTLYCFGNALSFHTWIPNDEELDWFSGKYGEIFDRIYRPRFLFWREREREGKRWYTNRLPLVCQTCQIPVFFTEPDDPLTQSVRESRWNGMKYTFCSDGCKDIFDHEPAKYCQAYIPPQQIYQGNCGGARDIWEYAAWLHLDTKADTAEYNGSPDQKNWEAWHAQRSQVSDAAA